MLFRFVVPFWVAFFGVMLPFRFGLRFNSSCPAVQYVWVVCSFDSKRTKTAGVSIPRTPKRLRGDSPETPRGLPHFGWVPFLLFLFIGFTVPLAAVFFYWFVAVSASGICVVLLYRFEIIFLWALRHDRSKVGFRVWWSWKAFCGPGWFWPAAFFCAYFYIVRALSEPPFLQCRRIVGSLRTMKKQTSCLKSAFVGVISVYFLKTYSINSSGNLRSYFSK